MIHSPPLVGWLSCFSGRPSTVTAGDGADARAGQHRSFAGKPKGRSKEHFLSQPTDGTDAAADARAARVTLERLLETDAPGIAATLPPGFADAVERYVALLLEANARLNLTRVTEPDAVARLHLLDALSALPLVDSMAPTAALDLGSGGGVPGLVLALARPEVAWTLVDSVGKKCDALRAFADALDLRSLAVVADRAEVLGRNPQYRERYELVAARACAALPVLAEYALPLTAVGGALLAWKGSLAADDDEVVRGTAAAALLGGGQPAIHGTGVRALGDHRFVVVTKERPTPARYPRRAGEPARHPLPRGGRKG